MAATESNTKIQVAFVNSDKVNLRSEGSVSSNILDQLVENEIVDVLATSSTSETIDGVRGSWWKVRQNEMVGFVFSPYLSAIEFRDGYQFPENRNKWATKKFDNSFDQARFNENRIIGAIPDRLDRIQNKISIKCENGKIVAFTDKEGEKGPNYSVSDYFQNRYLVIETQYYEGKGSQLVDLKTGETIDLVGSDWRMDKNSRWIAFMNVDTEYSDPGFQVIDLENFHSVFQAKEPAYDAVWKSDVEFEVFLNSIPTSEYKTFRYKLTMRLEGSTWKTDGRRIKLQ